MKTPNSLSKISPFRQLGCAGLAAAFALLAGCGKEDKTDPSVPVVEATFSSIYSVLLGGTCLECHRPENMSNVNLDFSTKANAWNTFRNGVVSGAQAGSACAGLALIAPSSPPTSFAVTVLNSEYQSQSIPGSGGCVPYTDHYSYIANTQQANAIKQWVTSGAQNN